MKKKTSKILGTIGLIGFLGTLGGFVHNRLESIELENNPWIKMEERVLSLENELKGSYQFAFKNPESQELYQKAVQKEYETLKPAYEEAQPEIRALNEEKDKNNKYGWGLVGLEAIFAFGFLAPAVVSKKED